MKTSETIPGLTDYEKKILDSLDEVSKECDEIEKLLNYNPKNTQITSRVFQNLANLLSVMKEA